MALSINNNIDYFKIAQNLRFKSNSIKQKKVSNNSKRASGIIIGINTSSPFFNEVNTNKAPLSKVKTKNSIIDEPSPEGKALLYDDRKEIIFGNLMENDYLIDQFILKTQLNMMKFSKIKSSYFGETNVDVYDKIIKFKEAISNYCLVIKMYLLRKNYNRALQLYLLMIEYNEKLFQYFFKKIKEQLPKISNANRIGKFYPSITKNFIQIISCLIKLSDRFNKPEKQVLFIEYYIRILCIVSKTVFLKFGLMANASYADYDLKHISQYIYANIIFDLGIYYFIKYHPFSIIINMLQHILELYKDSSISELIMAEQIVLLKTNFNLGLFLYMDGNNYESVQCFLKSKAILSIIKTSLPSSKYTNKIKVEINENEEKDNKKLWPKLSHLKAMQSNGIKVKPPSSKSLSNKLKDNNNSSNNKKKIFKNQILIFFHNQLYTHVNYEKSVEKIYNEIELILAEIELSKNSPKEVFEHINKLLRSNISRKRSGYSKILLGMKLKVKKEKEENNCNFALLNDKDKRKMMYLLEKIEKKFSDKSNNSTDKIAQKNNYILDIKRNNIYSKEMEKFFLFICNLSQYQIKVLNETQPKPSILRNSLPIVYTSQFKDCLTNLQRMNLALLETMSLSRFSMLKDPDKDISTENLDYQFMKYNIKDNLDIKTQREHYNKKNLGDKNNKTVHLRNNKNLIGENLTQTVDKRKIKENKEKIELNKILDDIINEKNRDFIDIFRDEIINVLMNLDKKELKLLKDSKNLLQDLIEQMDKQMIIKKK